MPNQLIKGFVPENYNANRGHTKGSLYRLMKNCAVFKMVEEVLQDRSTVVEATVAGLAALRRRIAAQVSMQCKVPNQDFPKSASLLDVKLS